MLSLRPVGGRLMGITKFWRARPAAPIQNATKQGPPCSRGALWSRRRNCLRHFPMLSKGILCKKH